MASPTEIANRLPETLPEDFGDWDSEPSAASVPGNSGGFEATRGSGDAPEPPALTPGPEVAPATVVDRLRGSALPSPARANADDGVSLYQPPSIRVDAPPPERPVSVRLPNAVLRLEEAARPVREVPFPPQRPKVSVSDGRSNVRGIAAAATPSPDEFLQALRPKIAVTSVEKKHNGKKWMMVAAVGACSILVLVILAIRLFTPGTPSTAKQSGEPGLTATEALLKNKTPKPSPSTPLTQDKVSTETQTQPTADSQPTEEMEEDTPPEVQSNTMNDQLAAPTRIPRDIKKPAVENEAPPSAGFATTGTEALGGGSAVPSVFNGARPIVHPAPSNTMSISAGVAVGLLIQKTPPLYPEIAKAARVSGTVEIEATISKTGTIKDMHVVNGPVMLRQAALDAVRNWRYKPYRLNNEPTEVQTTVNVIFSLGG